MISKKQWTLFALMFLGLLILAFWIIHETDPLRHSIDYSEFESAIRKGGSDGCNIYLQEVYSIEFNVNRFPIWERLHLTGKKFFRDSISNRSHIEIGRPFFSEQYTLGNDHISLILIASGFDNRVCLITIAKPHSDTPPIDQRCLKIIKQRFSEIRIHSEF